MCSAEFIQPEGFLKSHLTRLEKNGSAMNEEGF